MRAVIILCLLWVLSASAVAAPVSTNHLLEREAFALAVKNYEQLGRSHRVALIVMSTQNCIGCAMLAVNNAISSLHNYDSTIPCAVVVIAEDARDAATLHKKIATPYIAASTEPSHIHYASTAITALPVLAVFTDGKLSATHDELQRVPPDFAQLLGAATSTNEPRVLLASASGEIAADTKQVPVPAVTLEEPKDRSVKYLLSPVVTSSRNKLYGINHLTNSIESWDLPNGKLLAPIPASDTLKYFFRKNAKDTVWKITEQQGYDPARFIALKAVDDTVYALAMLLAGYDHADGMAVGEVDSSALSVYWKTQQVVVKIYDHAIRAITPLPEKYSFIELLADRTGAIGGTCFEAVDEGMMPPDSLAVVALVDRNGAARLWKTSTDAPPSLGSVAMSPDGTIWYCDPLRPFFFVSRPGGASRTIKPQKQLTNTGSILLLEAPTAETEKSPFPYLLESMQAWGDKVTLLLTPTDTAAHKPRLVQTYTANGEFLGESPLRTALIDKASVAWLLDVEDNTAIVLVETDKKWRLTAVPLSQQ